MKLNGTFRIADTVGAHSGEPIYELEYMAPEDHPGYGVWERVTSSYDRSDLEAFIASPPEWWGKS